MPIKIAVWNVENYGAKEINSRNQPKAATAGGGDSDPNPHNSAASSDSEDTGSTTTPAQQITSENKRNNTIVNLVQKTQPDILVLIEVLGEPEVENEAIKSKKDKYRLNTLGYRNCLIKENSLTGTELINVLQALKGIDQNWQLIPPRFLSNVGRFKKRINKLVINECMAVFYRADHVQFLGPSFNTIQTVSNGEEKYSVAEPESNEVTKGVEYNGIWETCLPESENTLSGSAIKVGGGYPPECNTPFLTRFKVLKKGNDKDKVFDLISFHASREEQYSTHKKNGETTYTYNQNGTKNFIKCLNTLFEKDSIPQIAIGDFNAPLDIIDNNNELSELIKEWEIAIPKGQFTHLPLPEDLNFQGGKCPNFESLKPYPLDNALVRAGCNISTMICNPFIGGIFIPDSANNGSLKFDAELKCVNGQGKEFLGKAIPEAFENKEIKNKALTHAKDKIRDFFIEQREISDHLPFVIEVELGNPPAVKKEASQPKKK